MIIDAIECAIKILQLAIKEKISIAEASRRSNRNVKYVFMQNKRHGNKKTPRVELFLALLAQVSGKEANHPIEEVAKEGLLGKGTVIDKETINWFKDEGVLDARGNKHVKTLDQLISQAKIDTEVWNVDRHVINKWDVTNAEGQTYQNWQVKAWLSKNKLKEEVIDASKMFNELIGSIKVKHTPVKYKAKKEHNLLEINIFDLHLGKLCWAEEVNNNYDIKIASKRFNYALDTLLKRASVYDIERILFPVGNDFFNSDNHVNTTTLGTRQDEDVRWQKSFKIGHKLLTDGIDRMREIAPVDVMVIKGNHDGTKSFYLGEVLDAFYRNDSSVSINNSPNSRKYYEYGKVLLGLTHGDKEKHEALRSLMAYEAKEAWARTTYKEFHLGHQHRKISHKFTVKSDLMHEELGIIIRMMSSLAGTDVWHHEQGYLGPTRAAEAFIWNKESGLIGNLNVNIKLNDDL